MRAPVVIELDPVADHTGRALLAFDTVVFPRMISSTSADFRRAAQRLIGNPPAK